MYVNIMSKLLLYNTQHTHVYIHSQYNVCYGWNIFCLYSATATATQRQQQAKNFRFHISNVRKRK